MSRDSVDDIEHAEDLLAQLYLAATTKTDETAWAVLHAWEGYCRPTCDTHGEAHDGIWTTCGCPCHDLALAKQATP